MSGSTSKHLDELIDEFPADRSALSREHRQAFGFTILLYWQRWENPGYPRWFVTAKPNPTKNVCKQSRVGGYSTSSAIDRAPTFALVLWKPAIVIMTVFYGTGQMVARSWCSNSKLAMETFCSRSDTSILCLVFPNRFFTFRQVFNMFKISFIFIVILVIYI